MRAETNPGTGRQAGTAALGVEERSDETPRAEDKQPRSAPDPEVVAKPTRRQFTAEYRLSLTALMEPPMFGFMEPLTGADLWSRTG